MIFPDRIAAQTGTLLRKFVWTGPDKCAGFLTFFLYMIKMF